MRSTLLLTVIFLSQFSFHAQAGWGRGNGGDIIKCDSPAYPNYQMLDLYELTTRYHNHVWSKIPSQPTTEAMLEVIFQRAEKYNSSLGAELRIAYKTMISNWKSANTLMVIDDMGNYKIPQNCHLSPVANQLTTTDTTAVELKNIHEYYIDAQTYKEMDPINRATLILHEIFWSISIDSGPFYPSTSVEIRAQTIILMSEDDEFNAQLPRYYPPLP